MKTQTSQTGSTAYVVVVCFVATLGGLLFGYDTAVISGAIGFMVKHFSLTPAMEGWAAGSALVGCILGAAIAGPISDRFGRRMMLILSAVFFLVSAIGTAVPRTLTEFIFYRALGGVGVGAAAMTGPMYIAELSPARLRGTLVSWNQFAIVMGMLVVYFVNYFIAGRGDEQWNITTGWRWMFGSEALPAAAFLALLFFVPESPRWLAKQGRKEDARRILTKVDGPEHAERELAEIENTLNLEGESFSELFQPQWRPVLWIGVVLAVLQQITGINVFLYFAPEILKTISGAKMDLALLQTVLVGAVNMIFTIIAIRKVDHWGRKPLMLAGYAGMAVALFALGGAALAGQIKAWILVAILGYIAAFALSVGPVTWVLLSEIYPTRHRGRAMAIATFCLWTANYIISQTFPMMDKNEWLVAKFNHGFPFLLYGVFSVIAVMFVWRRVPETKGQSLEEIELHWRK
jgi:SP family xylose:H+ symportor-like MFS transporter